MKFIVDKMPEYKDECIFCRQEPSKHYDKSFYYTCKIDNKNCNLLEGVHVQYTSCRWLKENKS